MACARRDYRNDRHRHWRLNFGTRPVRESARLKIGHAKAARHQYIDENSVGLEAHLDPLIMYDLERHAVYGKASVVLWLAQNTARSMLLRQRVEVQKVLCAAHLSLTEFAKHTWHINSAF
jgi:hypothetical protein